MFYYYNDKQNVNLITIGYKRTWHKKTMEANNA